MFKGLKSNKKFIFVVCGGKEHIDTLHFSLRALQKFSQNEIIVLTDSARNEIPIMFYNVIDIETPHEFNNHQASIFLKTGACKFLPRGPLYCYLDTDVVALDSNVDMVFSYFKSPVTFASDHCRINAFSPSAINCGCLEQFDMDTAVIKKHYQQFSTFSFKEQNHIKKCMAEINLLVEKSKRNRFIYFLHQLQYALPLKYYYLNTKYKLNKQTKEWNTFLGNKLSQTPNNLVEVIQNQTGFLFDTKSQSWKRRDETSLSNLTCNHLIEQIKETFNQEISDEQWQHWNGGVFLFDNTSESFLDLWHKSTLRIFENPNWKTRDQGTLAMAVWEMGLENHYTLPIAFNFLADYFNDTVTYQGDLQFHLSKTNQDIKPYFIHIYHQWENRAWEVWNDVEKRVLSS